MPPFAPKDKTRTEHIAAVDRVVYASPGDDFVILALADGGTAVGSAPAAKFPRGITFRFFGRWEDDPQRGPRFRFSTFVVHHAYGKTGVVEYLTKLCGGVGYKTAVKLWDRYGGEAVEKLRTSPEEVAAEAKLGLETCVEAAAALEAEKRTEATKIDLFALFERKGFGDRVVDRCIERWGAKAPAVVRRNPFALLGLPGAGFKRCDKLWTDLKLPPDALKRQGLAAVHLVLEDGNGHTWLSGEYLAARLADLVPGADPLKAFRFALRCRKLKKCRDDAGQLWLADYRQATAEERVAAAVARLSAGPNLWPAEDVPVSRRDGDRLPSAHQVGRLWKATAGPLGMLLGGPGTGKSHCTGYLLREVIARFGRSSVTCCAPTGKAAVRLTQALGLAGLDLSAKTIHSTLEIGRNGHDGEGWGFRRTAANPLDCQFLIVDETSMCDTSLMADLLSACATGTQVLLVGDPHQLPPVGHGAPLRDLIAAGVPHGELTQVRRNAGQIVHACARIKNGESFETCDEVDLAADPPRNLKFVHARDAEAARDALVELLKGRPGGFCPVWSTQVIVARNDKGAVSRKALNELLHPMLNPDGLAVAGNPFKVGDKIICTRNSWLHLMRPTGAFDPRFAAEQERLAGNYEVVFQDDGSGWPSRDPEEVYVANGEIGKVVAVGKGVAVARFSEGDDLVKVTPDTGRKAEEDEEGGDGGKSRGGKFEHAYAITVHKSQGSESPCVIVMADAEAGAIADRHWYYTAISRASKVCFVVGQWSAVEKQRLRQSLVRRKTFLAERVREALAPAEAAA